MISRPWKHPKTGVYWFRRVVPADLRAVLGKCEVKRSLETKDPQEAKPKHAAVLAEIETQWANLRAGPQELTERRAHELAYRCYVYWLEAHAENPSEPEGWLPEFFDRLWTGADPFLNESTDEATDIRIDDLVASGMRRLVFKQTDFAIEAFGLVIDDWGRLRLAKAIAAAIQRASLLLQNVEHGKIDPAAFEERLAEIRTANVRGPEALRRAPGRGATTTKSIKLMDLMERWWTEAQLAGRKPSTYESYRNTMKSFASFLSIDDASRVTTEDVIAYKDHRLVTPSQKTGKPPAAKTVKDSDLSALKTIFGWGVSNRLLTHNPAKGLTIKLSKPARTRSKGFTEPEARAILNAALKIMPRTESRATASAKKWVPWICAFSGARVGEIAQLRKQDVRREGSLWIIKITPEAGTVKTNVARDIVLHEQIVQLGFVEFVHSCSAGPLFLKMSAGGDVLGPLKGLTNRLAEFSRSIVADRGVAPNHGWRHRFKTVGIECGVETRVLDAIQGHAPRTDSGTYGDVTLYAIATAIARFPHIDLSQKEAERD